MAAAKTKPKPKVDPNPTPALPPYPSPEPAQPEAHAEAIATAPASISEPNYSPDLCLKVINLAGAGLSRAGIAGSLSVTLATLAEWEAAHGEFARALDIAAHRCAASWEARLGTVARTGKGSAAAAIFGLKNRGLGLWADRFHLAHGGDASAPPIRVEATQQPENIGALMTCLTALAPVLALKPGDQFEPAVLRHIAEAEDAREAAEEIAIAVEALGDLGAKIAAFAREAAALDEA